MNSLESLKKELLEKQAELITAKNIRQEIELEKVKLTLKRIYEGTYRNCDICNELISAKRMTLVPNTKHCSRCSEELSEIIY